MNRGDHRELISRDDYDRELFLRPLGEPRKKGAFLVHTLFLMSNHFLVVCETTSANLIAGMRFLMSTYIQS